MRLSDTRKRRVDRGRLRRSLNKVKESIVYPTSPIRPTVLQFEHWSRFHLAIPVGRSRSWSTPSVLEQSKREYRVPDESHSTNRVAVRALESLSLGDTRRAQKPCTRMNNMEQAARHPSTYSTETYANGNAKLETFLSKYCFQRTAENILKPPLWEESFFFFSLFFLLRAHLNAIFSSDNPPTFFSLDLICI